MSSSPGATPTPGTDPASTTPFSSSSSSTIDGSASTSASPTTGGASSTTTASDPGTGLGPPSSSLYLFTFLATLFLLLAISSAIIMRGIFLRRRFRRRLEEAIAAGVLLSPNDDGTAGFGAGGGRGAGRRKPLKRPTLFDVSVLPPYFSTADPQDERWERVMPVSASVSSEKPGLDPSAPSDSARSATATPPPRSRLPSARTLLEHAGYIIPRARLRRASPRDAPPSPAIPLGQQQQQPQTDPLARAAEVRVAVIIAMPSPRRSAYVPPALAVPAETGAAGKGKARGSGVWDDAEEEGVPDVVLGSARAAVAVAAPVGQAEGEGLP